MDTDVWELKPGQMSPLIEAAGPADLEAILEIEQASFSEPWTPKMIAAELEGNPFASFLVARQAEGGAIQGYICYWIVFEELRLMNLAVPFARRHRGIATALVRHALQDGCRQGGRRALLEVRASNIVALALYGKFGFQRVGRRTRYYANPVEDAILMELNPAWSPTALQPWRP